MARTTADPRFARHIAEWPFSELDQAAMDLNELLASRGWGVVKGLLEAELEKVQERLTQGGKPLEQAEYALLHGEQAGLAAAQAAIKTVFAKYSERRALEEAAVGAAAGSE